MFQEGNQAVDAPIRTVILACFEIWLGSFNFFNYSRDGSKPLLPCVLSLITDMLYHCRKFFTGVAQVQNVCYFGTQVIRHAAFSI